MNAGELIDLSRTLSGMPDIPPAHILTLLNVVNNEVSRDLRLPIGTVDFRDVTLTSQLQVPSDGREEGILALYRLTVDDTDAITDSTRLPMWSFQQASEYEPNWTLEEADSTPRFVVYDPPQLYNNPTPVPPPSASTPQSFRMVYMIKPCDMENFADLPLDGKHPSFHDILAFRTAYLLTRDDRMLREYELKIRRARAATVQTAPVIQNPMFQATAGWRGGR